MSFRFQPVSTYLSDLFSHAILQIIKKSEDLGQCASNHFQQQNDTLQHAEYNRLFSVGID